MIPTQEWHTAASLPLLFMLHASRGLAAALFPVLCPLGPRQKEWPLWGTCPFGNRGKRPRGETKHWVFRRPPRPGLVPPAHNPLAQASPVARFAVTTEGTSPCTQAAEQSVDPSFGEAREYLGRGLPSAPDRSRQLQTQHDKALEQGNALILIL